MHDFYSKLSYDGIILAVPRWQNETFKIQHMEIRVSLTCAQQATVLVALPRWRPSKLDLWVLH